MRSPPSYEKVTKECARCGKSVTRAPSLMKTFKYCSKQCATNKVTKKCLQCGSDFTKPASLMTDKVKFCSKKCFDIFQTKNERNFVCSFCGKGFIRNYSSKRSKLKFCSDECQRKAMVRELHPRWKGGLSIDSDDVEITHMPRNGVVAKYMRTHRKIASESIGRLLERHEHVLHINNDKDDNSPDNLFICGSVNECLRRIWGSLQWPTKSNLSTYK